MNKIASKVLTALALTVMAILLQSGEVQAVQSWGATASMATPRSQHAVTVLQNGRVLVTGGTNTDGRLKSAELYNPVFGTWSTAAPMTVERTEHTATLLDNGKVLVVGGKTALFDFDHASVLDSAELYDPGTNTWTVLNPMSTPRTGHCAVLMKNINKVLVIGGRNLSDGSLARAELYDVDTQTWSDASTGLDATAKLYLCGAVYYDPSVVQNLTGVPPNIPGAVLVAGGENFGEAKANSEIQLFAAGFIADNPAEYSWQYLTDMANPRSGHTVTLLADGSVLILGGRDGNSDGDFTAFTYPTAELYLPSGTINTISSLNVARSGHTATYLSSYGTVMVTGGQDDSSNYLSSTELLDALPLMNTACSDGNGIPPTSCQGTWVKKGSMSAPRANQTASYLADDTLLVVGGQDSVDTYLSSANIYGDNQTPFDLTAPTISTFTLTPKSVSATTAVANVSITASDNVGVTAYCLSTINDKHSCDTSPPPNNWTNTKPPEYTFNGLTLTLTQPSTTKTLYAFVKDAAGNPSLSKTATVTLTRDTTPPVVTFTGPASGYSTSWTIPVTFSATDAGSSSNVTGYMITAVSHGSTAPSATGSWQAQAPTTVPPVSADGSYDLYAWAKDVIGNVSVVKKVTVIVDKTPPVVTFTVAPTVKSLTIPVSFSGTTDGVSGSGIAGYKITMTNTSPLATDTGWLATAPTSYAVTTAGAKTLYGWVKDKAGNVSSATATVTIDTTPPVVTAFSLQSPVNSISNVPITVFSATDNRGSVNIKYLVTATTTTPAVTAAGWSTLPPENYTSFTTAGTKTLYAWAKDDLNNISLARKATVIIDTTIPTVSTFTVKPIVNSTTVPVTAFTAADSVGSGIAGYLITKVNSQPDENAVWSPTAPTSYDANPAGDGPLPLYAWAKDNVGKVSSFKMATTRIDTSPPLVTIVSAIPPVSGLTVPVKITASDTNGSGVAGYLVTETSAVPLLTTPGWKTTTLTTYTFSYTAKTSGSVTLYAWARDAAGNISNSATTPVVINMPAPVVATFTIKPLVNSTIVPVTAFTASTSNPITGYMITNSSTPPTAGVEGWNPTVPTSYDASSSGDGTLTLYAWVKNGAGNVSQAQKKATTRIDTTAPLVTIVSAIPPVSGLTVPVKITASDTNGSGVAGYLVTETSAVPLLTTPGWKTTTLTTYTFSYTAKTSGSVTLYAWARDAAGNISNSATTPPVTINMPAPVVATFTIKPLVNSTIVPVTAFTASTSNPVTGYMITDGTTPSAGDNGWSNSPPDHYDATPGDRLLTLSAWVKNGAGNVSKAKTAVTRIDMALPQVTAFTLALGVPKGLTVSITSFTTTAPTTNPVNGYLVTETSDQPLITDPRWKTAKPTTYTAGSKTIPKLYAWVKNAAGTVSEEKSVDVAFDQNPPVIDIVTATPTISSTSPTVSVTITATDNVLVTGYLITETSDVPLLTTGWKTTKTFSYTVINRGAVTLYAWARDAAGNISYATKTVTINIPKPVVTAFTVTPRTSSLTVPITSFEASDDAEVTGYLITESTTIPKPLAPGWSIAKPGSYTCATTGTKKLYAWVKDPANNVSASKSATVVIPATVVTTLSGRVTDENGVGVAGVTVQVYNAATAALLKTATTSASGAYTISGLDSRAYKVFFDGSALWYSRKFYNGSQLDMSGAPTVTVGAAPTPAPVTGIDAVLTEGGSISGWVTDATGTGIAGVRVSSYQANGTPVWGAGSVTSASGFYTIGGLPPGFYRVQFDGSGYAVKFNGDKPELNTTDTAVEVIAGQAVNDDINATLTVTPIAGISGQVTNGTEGVPNVGVSAYTAAPPYSFVKSAVTDIDGKYTVSGLTSRAYKVFFDGSSMGYNRTFSGEELFDIGTANTVTVAAPTNKTGINAVLSAAGSISGRVTDGSNGISGINVTPYATATGDVLAFGAARMTDANGNYAINGLPAEYYKIMFSGTGWITSYFDTKSTLDLADTVQVSPPADTSDKNAALTAD